MNRDFVEMLSALVETQAKLLVVGAHALAAHGVFGRRAISISGSGREFYFAVMVTLVETPTWPAVS